MFSSPTCIKVFDNYLEFIIGKKQSELMKLRNDSLGLWNGNIYSANRQIEVQWESFGMDFQSRKWDWKLGYQMKFYEKQMSDLFPPEAPISCPIVGQDDSWESHWNAGPWKGKCWWCAVSIVQLSYLIWPNLQFIFTLGTPNTWMGLEGAQLSCASPGTLLSMEIKYWYLKNYQAVYLWCPAFQSSSLTSSRQR